MKPTILVYQMVLPRDERRAVELEYFLRGAVAMSSQDVDWLFNEESQQIRVFCADKSFQQKLEAMFGFPQATILALSAKDREDRVRA